MDVSGVMTLFDYAPNSDDVAHWYPNFAHSCLFVAYSGALLAQDELQVMEHPILGSLRSVRRHVSSISLLEHTWDYDSSRNLSKLDV